MLNFNLISIARCFGPSGPNPQRGFDLLAPLRHWLNHWNIQTPELAYSLCRLIPTQCPFERDKTRPKRVLFHIPPLCKLNPLYEEIVALRFRALCYLADECQQDVRSLC